MTEEEQLVKQLKASFPDMLDFNSNLKKLRTFWKEDERKRVLEIIDSLSINEYGVIGYYKVINVMNLKLKIQQGEK